MVNSKCVVGSSTGMRAFSAKRTISSAASVRLKVGALCAQALQEIAVRTGLKDIRSVCRASAAKDHDKAGSANAEKVTSRLAPIPSKLEPVSSAARTVEKRPSAIKYATTIKSPVKDESAGKPPNGISVRARRSETSQTTGPS